MEKYLASIQQCNLLRTQEFFLPSIFKLKIFSKFLLDQKKTKNKITNIIIKSIVAKLGVQHNSIFLWSSASWEESLYSHSTQVTIIHTHFPFKEKHLLL